MHRTIQVGELTATVGDNAGYDGHRQGYNGLHSLASVHCAESLFVDRIAGLNLEHLLDGRDMPEPDQFFEPRRQPMELEQFGERSVQLYQAATPTLKAQSLTTFRLTPPHYVDMEFRVVVREPTLHHGYLLCFWASYIRAPQDPAIYFLGRPRDQELGEGWQRLRSPEHGVRSTVCHLGVQPELKNEMASRGCLAFSYSELAFTRPFYYGRRGRMVYAVMFDLTDEARFTHSPSGGGKSPSAPNPAWDFQMVIPRCEVDQEYLMHARVVYKRWVDERDLLKEYESWDPLMVE